MRSTPLAAALIILTVLGTSGSWHLEGDDPDFLPAVVVHDHSAHHEAFRTPATPQDTNHCAICHWLQMFRAGSLRHGRIQFASALYNVRVMAAIPTLRAGALLDVPSRAPPV